LKNKEIVRQVGYLLELYSTNYTALRSILFHTTAHFWLALQMTVSM